jgi:2-alkyl-3-oxoalkanoate reductase
MNIFVVGASGAIGQPLIIELICQGHKVTGMCRPADEAKNLVDLAATINTECP